jgi:hypothetical protein
MNCQTEKSIVQTHQVEIRGEACLNSCSLIFRREEEDDVSSQNTPPYTPPSADNSNVLRKSSRIGPNTKQSYKGMQSRHNGEGRPRKRVKYTIQENSSAVTNAPVEVMEEPVSSATSAGPSTNTYPFGKPLSNCPPTEATPQTTAIPAKDHSNIETALHTVGEATPAGEPRLTDGIETTILTSSLPRNEDINTRRSVLDEAGNSLETVLEALKTQDTDRLADSAVPSTCAALTNTDPIVFARIISTIGINCVETNRTILASALEVEKERL